MSRPVRPLRIGHVSVNDWILALIMVVQLAWGFFLGWLRWGVLAQEHEKTIHRLRDEVAWTRTWLFQTIWKLEGRNPLDEPMPDEEPISFEELRERMQAPNEA